MKFFIEAWTDYPFSFLGDELNQLAPVRKIIVLDYDGDKYVNIIVDGYYDRIKSGYVYSRPGRYGEVPVLPTSERIPRWYKQTVFPAERY